MLTELPCALRQRFGFDPAKAMKCVADTEAADQRDREALLAEENRQDAAAAPHPVAPSAPAASMPPVVSTLTTVQPAAPAKAELDQLAEAQKQDIRDKIQSLQDDIARMQGEEAKVFDRSSSGSGILYANGATVSRGGYPSMIVDD